MKKVLKSRILIAIITAIICIGGSVCAAIKIQSSEIGYKDGTVEEALNDLYSKSQNSCSDGEDYDNKPYTQEGLTIYNNRITILDGGYYIDENNTTWVNMTFKLNVSLSNNDIWLLIYNFPGMDNSFAITDTSNQYVFRSNSGSYAKSLYYTDRVGINKDTVMTLKFKY